MLDAVAIRERAVYVEPADALVVADLHVGRGAASNVDAPLGEREDLVDRLAALLDEFAPSEVVIAGDLLHSFSTIPHGASGTVEDLLATIEASGAEFVLTPGNHDSRLDAVYDGPTTPAHRLADGTVVCHGHEQPETDADCYVIGHDHPTIEIEGRRRPCVLYGAGAYRGADVLALPSFTRLAPGVAVNGASGDDLSSPLLSGLESFRPVVRDSDAEETLRFPPLASFREML